MIVLIRKWIAWLALAVVVAVASLYWLADEWQLGEKIEATQVLSWNIINDNNEEEINQEQEDKESSSTNKPDETSLVIENEDNSMAKSDQEQTDETDSPDNSQEDLTENVIGSVNIEPSTSEVLNEELEQTGVKQTDSTWQEEAQELKWQRQTQLAQEYDDLKYLAESAQSESVRAQAQERMLEIKNAQSIVQQAESMLQLKGYEAAVFVEGEQISAVIAQELIQTDGTVIAEILERISGFAKENILVIPR